MNRAKIFGATAGLIGVVAGIVLISLGKLDFLQGFEPILGIFAGIAIVIAGWVVTRHWVVPSLFALGFVLILVRYFAEEFLPENGSAIVFGAIVSLVLDVAVFVILVLGLVFHVKSLREYFRR